MRNNQELGDSMTVWVYWWPINLACYGGKSFHISSFLLHFFSSACSLPRLSTYCTRTRTRTRNPVTGHHSHDCASLLTSRVCDSPASNLDDGCCLYALSYILTRNRDRNTRAPVTNPLNFSLKYVSYADFSS